MDATESGTPGTGSASVSHCASGVQLIRLCSNGAEAKTMDTYHKSLETKLRGGMKTKGWSIPVSVRVIPDVNRWIDCKVAILDMESCKDTVLNDGGIV